MSAIQAGDALLTELRGRLLAPCSAEELVPPPRFVDKTFASYRLDQAHPDQGAAVQRVWRFAVARRPRFAWLRRARAKPGLYLDGGFGVGKTHLLAASFHAAHGVRRYCSFAEAIGLVVLRGPRGAAELLAADLVCIDEFELDDPANTRLADLLIAGLIERGCRIMTTSNTVPGELGEGRLFVDQFRAQLDRISGSFDDVHVPGSDWRLRVIGAAGGDPPRWHRASVPTPPGALRLELRELDALLMQVPVVNLRRLAQRLPRLHLAGVRPFTDQLAALRFVHLVDRLYDHRVELVVEADCASDALFPEEHCLRAFAKKYRRCSSRLVELCA